MTIDRNFIELDIGNTELIVGSPRINRTGINPELFIATIGNSNGEQVVIGGWKTRREAIGELMNWAHHLSRELESMDIIDWVLEGDQQ